MFFFFFLAINANSRNKPWATSEETEEPNTRTNGKLPKIRISLPHDELPGAPSTAYEGAIRREILLHFKPNTLFTKSRFVIYLRKISTSKYCLERATTRRAGRGWVTAAQLGSPPKHRQAGSHASHLPPPWVCIIRKTYQAHSWNLGASTR